MLYYRAAPVILIVLSLSLLFSGCFSQGGRLTDRLFTQPPAAPEPRVGWEVTLTKVLVEEAEEDRSMFGIPIDDGDEPYFVVVGIKSTLGTSGETEVVVNNYRDKSWAGHLRNGQQKTLPLPMGRIRFDGVAKKDVIGVLVIAFEADLTPWSIIDERVNALTAALENAFVNAIETRVSIDASTNAFVNDMHATMHSSARILTEPENVTQSLERRVFSLSDVDDAIGVNSMLFLMRSPSEVIRFPSYQGYFLTDILDTNAKDYRFYQNALVFDTNDRDARYQVEVRLRAF